MMGLGSTIRKTRLWEMTCIGISTLLDGSILFTREHLALVIELSVGFYWNVKNSEFQRYLLWVPETKECYF
jgi:hypothetical protein